VVTLNIIQTQDQRDVLSEHDRGIYYVHKRNCLAAFPFGEAGHYNTANEAFDAMKNFLQSRKDADKLRVTLIERG